MTGRSMPIVPRATYRLQFHEGFGFEDARRIVPYLAALGVSHVYASPLTRARPGSTHGYDVIDFNHLNPELGDDAAFEALVADAARARHGAPARLRAQPHGGRLRQPLVARRARVGTGQSLCDLLRHRLGGERARGARQDHPAGARRSVRQGARGGRPPAAVRRRRGRVLRRLLRRALSDRGAPVSAAAALDRRSPGSRGGRAVRAGREVRCARRRGGEPGPVAGAPAGGVRAQGGAGAGGERCRRARRPRCRGRRAQRHARPARDVRAAPCAPGGPGLSPCLLAGRELGDQLPALLRHQSAGWPAHGAGRGVRGHPPPAAAPDRRGQGAGRAPRPHRRHVRPARLLPAPAVARRRRARRGSGRRTPRGRSPQRPPDLPAGREDPRPPREPARGPAGRRHHRLRVHQPGERPVRRPRGRSAR